MKNTDHSLSLANPNPVHLDAVQKSGLALGAIGLLILVVAWVGVDLPNPLIMMSLSAGLMTLGAIVYGYQSYSTKPAGIKNNHVWFNSLTNRGTWGWIFGIFITGFYVLLYWFPKYLGAGAGADGANAGLVALFDPLSRMLSGNPASQWFVYGTLYTVAIIAMGLKFIPKYRHNRYQLIRTISVIFFQLCFAFLLPEILQGLTYQHVVDGEVISRNYPYNDFKNMWPLNSYFFDSWSIQNMIKTGTLGLFMLVWGVAMILIVSPILTYFYGKRWYCSWVCGCGGLAETAGDPWRHLSDKSLKAWQVERWLIHSILVLVIIVTLAVTYSYLKYPGEDLMISHLAFGGFVIGLMVALGVGTYIYRDRLTGVDRKIRNWIYGILGAIVLFTIIAMATGANVFFIDSYQLRKWYGFFISSAFAGVIGVGFYPLMGSRVWCRFGCPMAAILGLQQKFFSRFRITTNGGQCISCGNCSTYCEMGIDVRSYAQKGQDVVRASCVGCGICAAVCPRGVLRLENGSADIADRTKDQRVIHISEDHVGIL